DRDDQTRLALGVTQRHRDAGASERADRRRAQQRAQTSRTDGEDIAGEDRHEAAVGAEEIYARVHDEQSEDDGLLPDKSEPLHHALQAALPAWRRRGADFEQPQADDRREERGGVEIIAPNDAAECDDRAGDKRTGEEGALAQRHAEREAGRELLGLDQARDERVARRVVEAHERALGEEDRVDVPYLHRAAVGEQPEREREAEAKRLGRDEQAAPLDAVGEPAAGEREGDQRDGAEKSGEAELRGRVGHLVDLPSDGNGGELAADRGDEQAE